MRTFSVVQPQPTPNWPTSSGVFATTVVVEAGTSLSLLGYWWVGHGLALLSVLLLGLPGPAQFVMLAALATMGGWRAPRRRAG